MFCSHGELKGHFHYAQKKGYSGVGLYTRQEPSDIIIGIGVPEFDDEGRWVEKRFDKPGRKLSLISCYFPSGSSGEERADYGVIKEKIRTDLKRFIQKSTSRRPLIMPVVLEI